ncbi:unnamed protein product [Adineta steineri]|uniref:Uncharacterized protein n=1 Tax=Adineta steineri TaxID=433720 RepID=A0A813TN88_9BILA|nr:unnamed protein product [Adineta steineri]
MSYNANEANSHGSENYTERQKMSSFRPVMNPQYQQPILLPTGEQMFYDQFQSLQLAQQQQQQQQYYPEQMGPPLPLNANMPMMQQYYPHPPPQQFQQQQDMNYPQYYYQPYQEAAPEPMIHPSQMSTIAMRGDASEFIPAYNNTTIKETKPNVDHSSTTVVNDSQTKTTITHPIILRTNSEIKETKDSFIYDLKKYKYNYFLSKLTCTFDRDYAKFSSPTGISALNDDRLLVANFDNDTVLLLDLNGVVHQIYRDIPTPKDVRYHPTNSSQAIVATKKEVILLDLETSKVVKRSKMRGFYPWNIQYLQESDVIAACDPSSESILFLDNELCQIGGWSFNEPVQPSSSSSRPYQKVYPYAAYFASDNTSFILAHREEKCQLVEKDTASGETKESRIVLPDFISYSIFVDSAKQCLMPDKKNRRLVSIDKNSKVEEYKHKTIQEPHALTFLSTGTLCVTDWTKSYGSRGGIAILSETDLNINQ